MNAHYYILKFDIQLRAEYFSEECQGQSQIVLQTHFTDASFDNSQKQHLGASDPA